MYVLIPAYKPDMKLIKLVCELHERTDFRLIVVNDGSGAEFEEVFEKLPDYCKLLRHEVNCGKGRAMKTGFSYILEQGIKESVIIADADGQHTPEDIIKIAEKCEENPDSLVLGCRTFDKSIPLRSLIGNKITIGTFALASGKKVSDTQTGLRGVPFSSLEYYILIPGERYEYEMNMLLYTVENGIDIAEVPIQTVYIDNNASSHFNVLRDSIKIYGVMLKFIMASAASYVIDFVLIMLLSKLFGGMENEKLALLIATVGARAVSSVCNFMMNRKLVFKSRQNFWGTLIKYYLLVVVILGLKYVVLFVLNIMLALTLFWANAIAELLLFSFSYMVQRTFVFRNRR